METNQILKRLALIKHLYKAGEHQALQAEPFSSFALLQFHDAIEMLLILCCQHMEIQSNGIPLKKYWELLDLSDLGSIMMLNERRKTIKHKGVLVAKLEVDESRLTTYSFLKTTTFNLLKEDFDTISLIDLVGNTEVREYLKEAERFYQEKEYNKSCSISAVAFAIILSRFTNWATPMEIYFDSPTKLNTKVSRGSDKQTNNLANELEKTNKAVNQLQTEFFLLRTGLDYRKFKRFKKLTPTVCPAPDGRLSALNSDYLKCDEKDAQFCIDFVVEAYQIIDKAI